MRIPKHVSLSDRRTLKSLTKSLKGTPYNDLPNWTFFLDQQGHLCFYQDAWNGAINLKNETNWQTDDEEDDVFPLPNAFVGLGL